MSNMFINPFTTDNVMTYVVKDNLAINFAFGNHEIISDKVFVNSFYYSNVNNKPIKIACFDKICNTNENISLMPFETYRILDATNRLDDSLCIIRVNYAIKSGNKKSEKYADFYFKIVKEGEFKMYKDSLKPIENKDENGNITKPKAEK